MQIACPQLVGPLFAVGARSTTPILAGCYVDDSCLLQMGTAIAPGSVLKSSHYEFADRATSAQEANDEYLGSSNGA